MKDLMLMVSAMVPKEKLMEDLKEHLDLAISDPSDKEAYEKTIMHAQMLLIHHASKGDLKTVMELGREADEFQRHKELRNPGKN